jgi:hypothetical protein
MPGVAQKRGQIDPKHLIQIKAHSGGYAASRTVISVCNMECRA